MNETFSFSPDIVLFITFPIILISTGICKNNTPGRQADGFRVKTEAELPGMVRDKSTRIPYEWRIRMIKKYAHAKINLSLDVTGKRDDGYHEVCMVMQMVSLADVMSFEKTGEPGIHLTCSDPSVPCDEKNLVWQAAEMLMTEAGTAEGIRIHLEKHIPHAAGLAGGSSDAAVTLHAVNDIFDMGMTDEELCRIGVKIGADVPYCVKGGTALAEGIGEKLTKLPVMPACAIVLARPDVDVPTGKVYHDLDALGTYPHPDVYAQAEALRRGNLGEIVRHLGNVLEIVTASEHPEIGRIEKQLMDQGASGALMSGSGATVFGIFHNRPAAEKAAAYVKKTGPAVDVFTVEPVC